MGLPQVLCCICHPCVDISFSAGHFKWSWASVLQQINGVHNVLHLSSSYHTVVEWLPRHNKIHRGKLSDFIARYEWKEGDFPGKHVIVSPQIYSLCLKDGHLLSWYSEILWNIYFFLLIPSKKKANPDYENENRRPPSMHCLLQSNLKPLKKFSNLKSH